jgi:hypothetical protein
MKYILILYMCSMLNGQCPSSTVAGYQFLNHYDCIDAGYAVAQKTYRNLAQLEDFEREYMETHKIVVKFEMLPEEEIIIPKPKPKGNPA